MASWTCVAVVLGPKVMTNGVPPVPPLTEKPAGSGVPESPETTSSSPVK